MSQQSEMRFSVRNFGCTLFTLRRIGDENDKKMVELTSFSGYDDRC